MSDDDPEVGRGTVKKPSDPLEGEITEHGAVTRAQATIEVAAVEDMLAQVGDDPNMKAWLAYRLYVSGDYERAVDIYEQLIDAGHQVGENRLHLGASYLKLGRRDDARRAWEAIIEDTPESKLALKAQSRIVKLSSGRPMTSEPPPPGEDPPGS